jgi:hypothetical protein
MAHSHSISISIRCLRRDGRCLARVMPAVYEVWLAVIGTLLPIGMFGPVCQSAVVPAAEEGADRPADCYKMVLVAWLISKAVREPSVM